MSRQHKIAILKYTTKNFWMLPIPLVRGLAAVRFDVYRWFQGAYWDLIVIMLMIGFAVLRWYFVRFEVGEKGIFISHGILIRNEFTVPYPAVACASATRSLWLRPIRAVTVALDSDSHSTLGHGKKADVELIIKLTSPQIQKSPTKLQKQILSFFRWYFPLRFPASSSSEHFLFREAVSSEISLRNSL